MLQPGKEALKQWGAFIEECHDDKEQQVGRKFRKCNRGNKKEFNWKLTASPQRNNSGVTNKEITKE